MDATSQDPRKMTDGEVINWMQELVNSLVKDKGSGGDACSFEALKNPVRRNILYALEEKALSVKEISEKLEVKGPALRFHLNFLKSSYFISIEGDKVDLTPGGVSVIRSNKRN